MAASSYTTPKSGPESYTFKDREFISLPKLSASSVRDSSSEVLYNVTDFDFCKLRELDCENVKDCDICLRLKRRKVLTRYICSECNVASCPECYDIHHREQLLQALRTFRKESPKDLDIRISEEGNFYMKKNTNLLRQPSENTRSDEFWETICMNNLDEVVECLKKFCVHEIELMFDTDKKFRGIYFQDKEMESFFRYFPEFVTIDVTSEIVELELLLYLFFSEDSNGHCEILAVFLMNSDSAECLMWMFEMFKKHNANWTKIRTILVDKRIKNRNVLASAFPESRILVCKFHAMKSFKNDIYNKDFEMTDTEKATAVQIFETMLETTSYSEYTKQQEQLDSLLKVVGEYFNETWHSVREEWALCMKFNGNIFEATNNFLQHLKRNLKIVVSAQISLVNVIEKFFATLAVFRKERYSKVGIIIRRTIPQFFNAKHTPRYKYSKVLTFHAFELVIGQINLASEIKSLRQLSCGRYEVKSCFQMLTVTTNSCSCSFYTLLFLPCCHIFSVRKLLSLPLFVESLTSIRWTAKYYQNTFFSLYALFMTDTCKDLSCSQKKNAEDNFRKSFELMRQLLSTLLDNSPNSLQRINVIRQLITTWKEMIKVKVKVHDNPNLTSDGSSKELFFDQEYSIAHLKEIYGVSPQNNMDSEDDFSSFSLCSERSTDELSRYLSGQIDFNEEAKDTSQTVQDETSNGSVEPSS